MNPTPIPAKRGFRTLVAIVLPVLAAGQLVRSAEPEPKSTGTQEPPPSLPAGKVHWVVGISPFLDAQARNEVFRHLVRFVAEEMPTSSEVGVFDAYHLRSVSRMVIPGIRAFQSPKTRLNQFSDAIQATRRFLATDHSPPQVPGLSFHSALRLPQFLDFVAENLVLPGRRTVVIVLGSPLYQDGKEPGFSMARGYFPSDGHLLAGRDRTVYGLKDRSGSLSGVSVHFGTFGDPWENDLHRERITRFWRLFVEHQGGRMAGFSGDLPTVFQILRRGITDTSAPAAAHDPSAPGIPGPTPLDPSQSKVEMLRLARDVGSADWITGERVNAPAEGPPTSTRGPMKIGIRWQGAVDLDLYARTRPEGPRLYFEHPRIPEGYYFKDHRSSPDREYEFIEFTEPVDVRQVRAEINIHEGEAPVGGIGGEIRIEFENRIHSARFHLEATRGNRGREGDGQEPFWFRLDIPSMLKLRTP